MYRTRGTASAWRAARIRRLGSSRAYAATLKHDYDSEHIKRHKEYVAGLFKLRPVSG